VTVPVNTGGQDSVVGIIPMAAASIGALATDRLFRLGGGVAVALVMGLVLGLAIEPLVGLVAAVAAAWFAVAARTRM
jgi:hypothetical protein